MSFLIGIGGSGSGSGKTTVACGLLERLKGWGAVKCTPTVLYSSVVYDPEVLAEGDKDTGRFLEAGAGDVLWVRSTPGDLEETLGIALDRLSHLEGVIVEGNSAIEVLRPDVVIFISVSGQEGTKDSADHILRRADIVLFDTAPPSGTPEHARRFHRDDRRGYLDCVAEVIHGKKA